MSDTKLSDLFSKEDSYQTSNFQGPLEMLWALIEKQELDIEGLSLKELCSQLKNKLELWTDNPINKASENLYLLASLILLKSRNLLPVPEEEELDEPLIDSRLSFFKHLITYSQIQKTGHWLFKRQNESQRHYSRPLCTGDKSYRLLKPEEIEHILNRMSKKATKSKPIAREKYTLQERTQFIKNLLSKNSKVPFTQLFEEGAPRGLWIVSFLALLELMKQNIINVLTNEEEIWLCPYGTYDVS